MSHPKNSTMASGAQACPRDNPLVTRESEFSPVNGGSLFAVVAGVSCGDAMNVASASLSSAEALLGDLVADGTGTHRAYAVQVLIREAKALIDASVLSVELAEVVR